MTFHIDKEDGWSEVAMWWRNTIDRRFHSLVIYGAPPTGERAVIDDFGNLVQVP